MGTAGEQIRSYEGTKTSVLTLEYTHML